MTRGRPPDRDPLRITAPASEPCSYSYRGSSRPQVLARTWQQLAVPAIVATQPQLAFSSATISNDVLVACGFAAVLAWCAWLLRIEPDRRQGWTLGAVVGVALLAKTTALVAGLLAALTLLLAWCTHRQRGRDVAGMAWRASAVTVALAGWWYVIMFLETGSPIGNKGAVAWNEPTSSLIAAVQVWFLNFQSAWDWLRDAYWNYWVFQFPYEVGPMDGWELSRWRRHRWASLASVSWCGGAVGPC